MRYIASLKKLSLKKMSKNVSKMTWTKNIHTNIDSLLISITRQASPPFPTLDFFPNNFDFFPISCLFYLSEISVLFSFLVFEISVLKVSVLKISISEKKETISDRKQTNKTLCPKPG